MTQTIYGLRVEKLLSPLRLTLALLRLTFPVGISILNGQHLSTELIPDNFGADLET